MNTDNKEDAIVAVYASHTEADGGIKSLQKAGFDMKKLSILGKDYESEERAIGFYNTGDRMKFWGGLGAFWGGLWGTLFGGALFFIPTVGPLVILGPLVGWIAGTVEGAVLGGSAGVLGAALVGAGVPKDSVVRYEQDLKAGRFVILAHGTADQIERARSVLGTTGALQLNAHMA